MNQKKIQSKNCEKKNTKMKEILIRIDGLRKKGKNMGINTETIFIDYFSKAF